MIDNDARRRVDLDDPQCDGLGGTAERPECANGLDDDGGRGGGDYPNDPDCEQRRRRLRRARPMRSGIELAELVPLLAAWSRRVRRRRPGPGSDRPSAADSEAEP